MDDLFQGMSLNQEGPEEAESEPETFGFSFADETVDDDIDPPLPNNQSGFSFEDDSLLDIDDIDTTTSGFAFATVNDSNEDDSLEEDPSGFAFSVEEPLPEPTPSISIELPSEDFSRPTLDDLCDQISSIMTGQIDENLIEEVVESFICEQSNELMTVSSELQAFDDESETVNNLIQVKKQQQDQLSNQMDDLQSQAESIKIDGENDLRKEIADKLESKSQVKDKICSIEESMRSACKSEFEEFNSKKGKVEELTDLIDELELKLKKARLDLANAQKEEELSKEMLESAQKSFVDDVDVHKSRLKSIDQEVAQLNSKLRTLLGPKQELLDQREQILESHQSLEEESSRLSTSLAPKIKYFKKKSYYWACV
ncbi:hypothetical protein GEMRC1_013884 [Eukaryota sp. GEM-RC1]